MVQDNKKQQNITIYLINQTKYKVVTKTIESPQNKEKLYEILSDYIILQKRCDSYAKNI